MTGVRGRRNSRPRAAGKGKNFGSILENPFGKGILEEAFCRQTAAIGIEGKVALRRNCADEAPPSLVSCDYGSRSNPAHKSHA